MPAHLSSIRKMPPARRVLHIEEILSWLFIDELPKLRDDDSLRPRMASMHPMWKGGLFTRVDNWSREPGMPLAMGDPHPDAERIAAELKALAPESLDLSGYDLAHGFMPGALSIDPADTVARIRGELRSTIARAAKRKQAPSLETFPFFEPVLGTGGKTALWAVQTRQTGTTPGGTPLTTTEPVRVKMEKAGVYRSGTFCRLNWVHGADDDVEIRARYALWHAGLSWLANHLRTATREEVQEDGTTKTVPLLDTITVRDPRAAATPWVFTPPEPRVLMATPAAFAMDKKERVVAPLPPLKSVHGPVRYIEPDRLAA